MAGVIMPKAEEVFNTLKMNPADGYGYWIDDAIHNTLGSKGASRFIPKRADRSARLVVMLSPTNYAIVRAGNSGCSFLHPRIQEVRSLSVRMSALYLANGVCNRINSSGIANLSLSDVHELAEYIFDGLDWDLLDNFTGESMEGKISSPRREEMQGEFLFELARCLMDGKVPKDWLGAIKEVLVNDIPVVDQIAGWEYPGTYSVLDLDLGSMPVDFTTFGLALHVSVLSLNPYTYLWTAHDSRREQIGEIELMMEGMKEQERFAVMTKYAPLSAELNSFINA